jgi:predicted nucleic acid-binding protein
MAEGPVISNTSPLIKLAGVGLLDLLLQLYGTIWVAPEVRAEYQAKMLITDPDLDQLPWLRVTPVIIERSLTELPNLGAGEAATIALAMAYQARAVVLDDRLGRRVAFERQLPVVGTLGVLLRAKQASLINAVAPIIGAMVAQGRYSGTMSPLPGSIASVLTYLRPLHP